VYVPLNDLASPKLELERFAIIAAVKLLSIGQGAAVVDGDRVASLRFARAFYGVCNIDRYFCGERGGR
jgi:hypothetical protein